MGDKDWLKLYSLRSDCSTSRHSKSSPIQLANSFGPAQERYHHQQEEPCRATVTMPTGCRPPVPRLQGSLSATTTLHYTEVQHTDGVYLWETKCEVDSLAAHLRLPSLIAEYANRTDFLENETWRRGVRMAIDALRAQQRGSREEHIAYEASNDTTILPANLTSRDSEWAERFGTLQGGVYRFQRLDRSATETKADLDGDSLPTTKGWSRAVPTLGTTPPRSRISSPPTHSSLLRSRSLTPSWRSRPT